MRYFFGEYSILNKTRRRVILLLLTFIYSKVIDIIILINHTPYLLKVFNTIIVFEKDLVIVMVIIIKVF